MRNRLKFISAILGGTIGLVIGYFLVTYLVVNFVAKDINNITAHKSSTEFTNKEEKIEFMKKYVKLFSDIDDTEYRIDFLDNSALVKESASWNIKVALKMPTSSVNAWMEGFDTASEDEVKLTLWSELNLNDKVWKRDSKPQFYKRESAKSYMAVYKDEGIILKYTATK